MKEIKIMFRRFTNDEGYVLDMEADELPTEFEMNGSLYKELDESENESFGIGSYLPILNTEMKDEIITIYADRFEDDEFVMFLDLRQVLDEY
jgi:hypothetical protein